MSNLGAQNTYTALEDFRRSRTKAIMQEIAARLRGKPVTLLSFDETRQRLRAQVLGRTVLKDIPLSAIIGSVNRYEDFTSDFLPRRAIDARRWAGVKIASNHQLGLPAIEAYQIGEAYFVSDGNHRVSVAKEMGAKSIQGYVTEIISRVPLTPDTDYNDLILKSEYIDFLEHTQLDHIRPDSDLSVSTPGQYQLIEEHISVHRYFMGIDQKREISYAEAVAHWYDQVYLPVIQLIYELGLPRNFPKRTDADLYLWIAEYQVALEKELGDQVESRQVAHLIAARFNPKLTSIVRRISKRFIEFLTPDSFEPGPRTGAWRERQKTLQRDDRLFSDILVAVNGKKGGWLALEQAILVAQHEESRLRGLYVVRTDQQKNSKEATAIQETFNRRCEEANLPGKLVVAKGEISRKIAERASWNDLVIINLTHPISPIPLEKFGSGFRKLILRVPQPILVVRQRVSPLKHAMLAYDGSPKAKEALYVATYLAGQWQMDLTVATVSDKNPTAEGGDAMADAQAYLEAHNVQAAFMKCDGPVAPTLLVMAEETQSDLIIMGGYGTSPLYNLLSDDVVDQILRGSSRPILICR